MTYSTSDADLRDFLTPERLSDLHYPHTARPFITISRQAGAGGLFGPLLAQHLNQSAPSPTLHHPAWQCLNRELVERIAEDHHLSADLINTLQQSSHSFVAEFIKGIALRDGGPPSDLAILRRVAQTMRALAQTGHVILVGLGGVFMTHNMPAAIHIRIIAPLDYRIQNVATSQNLSESKARHYVKRRDEERLSYFHAFWPNQKLSDELFHLTLNSSLLTEPQMAQAVQSLLNPA